MFIVTKGSKSFITFSNCLSHFLQAAKREAVYVHQTCLSRNGLKVCLWVAIFHKPLVQIHC